MLLRQRGPSSRQIAQIANLSRWYEALAQQAVLVQIGDPLAVLLIGLAPGHNLDFLRVRQQQIESLRLQNIPHWLPVNTG